MSCLVQQRTQTLKYLPELFKVSCHIVLKVVLMDSSVYSTVFNQLYIFESFFQIPSCMKNNKSNASLSNTFFFYITNIFF